MLLCWLIVPHNRSNTCDLWGRGHHELSSADVLQVMLEVLLLQLLVLLLRMDLLLVVLKEKFAVHMRMVVWGW